MDGDDVSIAEFPSRVAIEKKLLVFSLITFLPTGA